MDPNNDPPVSTDFIDYIMSIATNKLNPPRNAPEISLIKTLFLKSLQQTAVRMKDRITSRQGTPQPETPPSAEDEIHAANTLNISSQYQQAVGLGTPNHDQGVSARNTVNGVLNGKWWIEDYDDDDFYSDEDDEDEDLNVYLELENLLANANSHACSSSLSSVSSTTGIDMNDESKKSNITNDIHSLASLDAHSTNQDVDHTGPQSSIVEAISIINNNQFGNQEESGNLNDEILLNTPWNNDSKFLGNEKSPFEVFDFSALDSSDHSKDDESCNVFDGNLLTIQENNQTAPQSSLSSKSTLLANTREVGSKQEYNNVKTDKQLNSSWNTPSEPSEYKEKTSSEDLSSSFFGIVENNNEENSCNNGTSQLNRSSELLVVDQENINASSQASTSTVSISIANKNEKCDNVSDASYGNHSLDHDPQSPLLVAIEQTSLASLLPSGSKSALTVAANDKKRFLSSQEDGNADEDGSSFNSDFHLLSKSRKRIRCISFPQYSTVKTVSSQKSTVHTIHPTFINKENFFDTKSVLGKRKREDTQEANPRKISKTNRQL